ncbi:MAG: NusG domain II-containing protein [Clostridiales Family XIII bacterium]|jgi:hypothetical protein|nr:NusG domain II-containing protein [Clostridiales Family XIII bacterium]
MKRIDAIIIALILVCAAAAMVLTSAARQTPAAGEPYAEVFEDGVLLRALPLREDFDIVVNTRRGYNRIVVEDGGVRVSEADCASQACVHSGVKSLPGESIVCLPHRLIIKIGGGEAPYDAITY